METKSEAAAPTTNCTWCYGSGEWVERRQVVPCQKCEGTGRKLVAVQ